MQQIQGEWAIIGVLGMVLFIVVIGKKIQMLLNFMIRIVLGGIGIIYANDFLGKENYQKICNQWNVHDMPYYILINRKGQIIDFGSSARPSNPNLRSRIEEAVKNIK